MSIPNRYHRMPFGPRPAAIGVGVMLALSGCERGSAPAEEPENDHPMVGAPAPDFDVPAQSGADRASLSEAEGKVVIVDFWATWCEPCRASFPKYEAMKAKFGDELVVFGISEDEEPEGIAEFAKETGATFALAWDSDKSIAASYSPTSMPTSYIIDRNGLIRFVHAGFREGDEQLIEEHVRALLQ